MAEAFLRLSPGDQREALLFASEQLGRPAQLLEKDVWVVWCLRVLFESPEARSLVFKGGTSLSKAYQVIDRFSEDIDLTYDVTHLVGELAETAIIEGHERLPANPSQAKRWRTAVDAALPAWISGVAAPILASALQAERLTAQIAHAQGALILKHSPAGPLTAPYSSPDVLLEFGGRSSGMPADEFNLTCDASTVLDLEFPTAKVRVMDIRRTFWEKATAVHSFCTLRELKTERLARHWFDLAELARKGHAETAIADRDLAVQVARHKALFFRAKGVDYEKAVSGSMLLNPDGEMTVALRDDYEAMRQGGLLTTDAPAFHELMKQIRTLQDLINAV